MNFDCNNLHHLIEFLNEIVRLLSLTLVYCPRNTLQWHCGREVIDFSSHEPESMINREEDEFPSK